MLTFRNTLSVPCSLPMKMEQTECSETSAYKIQMPGNYPEENTTYRTRQKFEIKNTKDLILSCSLSFSHKHLHECMRMCVHARTRARTHTHTDTHTHTCACMYEHIYFLFLIVNLPKILLLGAKKKKIHYFFQ